MAGRQCVSRPLSRSAEVVRLARKRPTRDELIKINALANSLAAHWLLKAPPGNQQAHAWMEELASEIDPDAYDWGPPVKEADLDAVTRSVLFDPSVLFGPLRPGRSHAKGQHRAFASALCEYGTAASLAAEHTSADRTEILDAIGRHLASTTTIARLVGSRSTAGGRLDVLMESVTAPYGRRSRSAGESLLERFTALVMSLRAMSAENRHQQLGEMAQELAQATVARVTGGATKHAGRVFRAFNSPFTPDVLVCTEVGDEGIDLHQFCRLVIHSSDKARSDTDPEGADEQLGTGVLVPLPAALFDRLRPNFAVVAT